MAVDSSTLELSMQSLLDCLCVALGTAGWEGECCLEPGVPAWGACCSDGGDGPTGKAWARLIEVYPTERFPTQSQAVDPSGGTTQWAMRVELGATTCVCFEMCDCDVRMKSARRVLNMAEAGLSAMACCSDQSGMCSDLRVVGLTMVGPEADCGGFNLQVVVPTQVCCPET